MLENARRKARAGLEPAGRAEAALVLGVDTDVALDGRLLGKPDDEAGARERLEALSGRTHEVLSGVVALGTAIGGEVPVERSAIARTEVTFARARPGDDRPLPAPRASGATAPGPTRSRASDRS